MNKLYLYLPVIICLILFFIFQSPAAAKVVVGYGCIFFLTILAVLFAVKWKIRTRWAFLIQNVVFILSALVFFLFLADVFWQIVFVLIFLFGLGFFLFHLFKLFNQPRVCQPDALEKMSVWQSFIIVYWALTGVGAVFGLNPLKWLFFSSLPLVFVLFYWLIYYSFFLKGGEFKLIKTDLLIISLVLTEIYLFVNFLPLGFYLSALLVSLLYTIIINLWQKIQQKKLISPII